jgi:hypothetical protein
MSRRIYKQFETDRAKAEIAKLEIQGMNYVLPPRETQL